jgi:hypothetical protein
VSSFRRSGVLARRYPALTLAFAATAVAFIPLTAAAATVTAPTTVTTTTKTTSTAKATGGHTAIAEIVKKGAEVKESLVAQGSAGTTAKTAKTAGTAKAETAAAVVVSTDPYAGVSYAQLEPTGTEGSQERFTPTAEQWANAGAIVGAAKELGLSAYAATIAVATAMQESSLRDLTAATNADSLGLFQQRPSMGWGTAAELTDPTYAAKAFLRQLPSDYESLSLADAAQAVQRSFDGSLYAQWESQAAQMVYSIARA